MTTYIREERSMNWVRFFGWSLCASISILSFIALSGIETDLWNGGLFIVGELTILSGLGSFILAMTSVKWKTTLEVVS